MPPHAVKKKESTKVPANSALAVGSQLELLRTRVATAESALKDAKEQSSEAKRRRKVAKQLAKRARKRVKAGKSELAKARKAMKRAEAAQISVVPRPAAKRTVSETKPAVRSATLRVKQATVAPWPPLADFPEGSIAPVRPGDTTKTPPPVTTGLLQPAELPAAPAKTP